MIVTFILEVRPLEDVAPPPAAPHAELPHTASRRHCHRLLPRLTPPLFQIITDNVTLIPLYTSMAPLVGRAAALRLYAAAGKTTTGDFDMSQAQFSMNGRLRGDPGVIFFSFLSTTFSPKPQEWSLSSLPCGQRRGGPKGTEGRRVDAAPPDLGKSAIWR